ncbi:MAG: hypothetical protein HOD92_24095 [Deltaproteobacteria bacterium]|jgi:hypothetical protein|nr:hypothetical protein [Deltaproteobacteria bacterium]
MKQHLIKVAEENNHWMIPISPDWYECNRCGAIIKRDLTGSDEWIVKKINILCPNVPTHASPIKNEPVVQVSPLRLRSGNGLTEL